MRAKRGLAQRREPARCHLLGCTEYGSGDHHHHWILGHENTNACHCANGWPR